MDDSAPIRVLLADDSRAVLVFLAGTFSAEEGFEVVGRADDAEDALALADRVVPDFAVFDVEMPGLDGVTAMAALRKSHPGLPVVFFSAREPSLRRYEQSGLTAPAPAWIPKPWGKNGAVEDTRNRLRQVARELTRGQPPAALPAAAPTAADPSAEPPRRPRLIAPPPFAVVAIGSSTGGPDALVRVLCALPRDFDLPIVIAQHIPENFSAQLANRLATTSGLSVHEGASGQRLLPGNVYLAPGGRHMRLAGSRTSARILLDDGPPEHACRPAVDPLFRSTAELFGATSLAVVLTGMGRDGTEGCLQIRDAGGQVLIQDQPTSAVWGMPGAVHAASAYDEMLPLDDVGPAVRRRIERRLRRHQALGQEGEQ